MSNYFEFYGIAPSFDIDTATLKSLFLAKSRQYHPDFYTQADVQTQEKALEMATYNNKAYQTLSDLDQRIAYLLTLKGLMTEGERYELPPAFLMQMMDINETIMELQMEYEPQKVQEISQEIAQITKKMQNDLADLLKNDYNAPEQTENLLKIKEFYYKKRYLLRIQKTILTFATQ